MAATNPSLEELIRKYYNGDTSLEEERELLNAFQEGNDGAAAEDWAQFLYFQKRKEEEPVSGALSRELDELMRSNPEPRRYINSRLIWRVAAMVILVLGIGWVLTDRYVNRTHTLISGNVFTPFTLPDGTTIWLNEGSELTYQSAYNKERREVVLRGEGYFEVKRNVSKPFVVRTGKVTTEVLGTSFNLRGYPEEQVVELAVTQGKVNFGGSAPAAVNTGEAATFDVTSQQVHVRRADLNAAAWKTGKLYFKNAALREVIRDLERYYHVKIEAKDRALLDCRLAVYFDHMPLEEVLHVICLTLNVNYDFRQDRYVLSGQTHCK